MLGSLAIGLVFLRAVDAAEADFFDQALRHDPDRITVNDTNNGPAEVFCERETGEKDVQHYGPDDRRSPSH